MRLQREEALARVAVLERKLDETLAEAMRQASALWEQISQQKELLSEQGVLKLVEEHRKALVLYEAARDTAQFFGAVLEDREKHDPIIVKMIKFVLSDDLTPELRSEFRKPLAAPYWKGAEVEKVDVHEQFARARDIAASHGIRFVQKQDESNDEQK